MGGKLHSLRLPHYFKFHIAMNKLPSLDVLSEEEWTK